MLISWFYYINILNKLYLAIHEGGGFILVSSLQNTSARFLFLASSWHQHRVDVFKPPGHYTVTKNLYLKIEFETPKTHFHPPAPPNWNCNKIAVIILGCNLKDKRLNDKPLWRHCKNRDYSKSNRVEKKKSCTPHSFG